MSREYITLGGLVSDQFGRDFALPGGFLAGEPLPATSTPGAWDSANKTSGTVLSDGDRTAHGDNNYDLVQSTDSHASGKFYAECTQVLFDYYGAVGVLTDDYSESSFTGTAGYLFDQTGGVYDKDGGTAASLDGWPALNGVVVSAALDATAGKIWFRVNGGAWNEGGTADPATGVGGFAYTAGPTMYLTALLGIAAEFTINTGTEAFAYASPAGFANWFGGAAPPAGRAKVWNGSAWAQKPAKVWSGSAWVTKPVKAWNGSAWV